jgi:hypothetical protein
MELLYEIKEKLIPDLTDIIVQYVSTLQDCYQGKRNNVCKLIDHKKILEYDPEIDEPQHDWKINDPNTLYNIVKPNQRNVLQERPKIYHYQMLSCQIMQDISKFQFVLTQLEIQVTGLVVVEFYSNKLYAIDKIFESIELDIGGNKIDKIPGACYGVMLKLYNLSYTITKINDDLFYYALPLPIASTLDNPIYNTEFHLQSIYIKLTNKDIKEIKYLCDTHFTPFMLDFISMPMRELNYVENIRMHIDSNISKSEILLYGQSTLVFFSFQDKHKQIIQENIIDKLELVFDDKTVHKATFIIIDDLPGFYFIPITRIINFWRIHMPVLKIYHNSNISMDLCINAYSIVLNEIRYCGGMCAKKYTI